MRFRAYVFDMDGTLIDSKIDFAAIRKELNLSDESDILESIERMPEDRRASAHAIVHKYEKAAAEESTQIDGALEFLNKLRSLGYPCAIFTRNSRTTTLESLKRHDFEIDLLVAREDAPPKPKPDGLYEIARSFGVAPNEMLFIGDYLYDLQAGLNAGTPTALYLPEPADFATEGAHVIFQSYQELTQCLH